MLSIIKLLPDAIANQIAAGEVVQRPASVVKELLENAIDASAQQIQLLVKDAGRTLVQVTDDGSGMPETDARMCFERHATSKIQTAEDLFKIKTMGFRGEAMASIAAVAQVELRTRPESEDIGTLIRIEASELKTQEPVQTPVGTSVSVKNLFFNVPARRSFLKSNSVEMRHILDEFNRVALAYPEVGMSLHHNDIEVCNLPAGKLSRRIIDLFGKNYREQLVETQQETDFLTVSGYIGKPEFAKKVRGDQFFFVNRRFIKHPYLHHAVLAGLEGLLTDGQHPFYVLNLEIDPARIDINVHPTKTEIKFDDERSVYGLIKATIKRATGLYHLAPSIDFGMDVNFIQNIGQSTQKFTPQDYAARFEHQPQIDTPDTSQGRGRTSLQRRNANNWEQLFEGIAAPPRQERHSIFDLPDDILPEIKTPTFPVEPLTEEVSTLVPETPPEQGNLTFKSKANTLDAPVEETLFDDDRTFQLQNRYVFCQVKSGLMMIDQKAAYERILFDRFGVTVEGGTSQQLLFPKSIALSPADIQTATDAETELKALGFEFTVISRNAIMLYGVPVGVEDGHELFEHLLAQYTNDQPMERAETLARATARRAANQYVRRMTSPEMRVMIDQLFASSNPNYTPSGEVIFRIVSTEIIAGLIANGK